MLSMKRGARLKTITHGNGIVTTRAYRNDNLTQSITTTGVSNFTNGANGLDFGYTYDANKNKLTESISAPMANYGFGATTAAAYDAEDRLIGWNRDDNNKSQSWALSLVGDWDTYSQTGSNPFTETRTHGDTHELTNIAGGNNPGALVHDAKGNITGNSNTQSYGWDFDNRMRSVTVPASTPGTQGTHNYTYDALGRRVSKTVNDSIAATSVTTVFVSTGQRVIAEYLANSAPTSTEHKYVYTTYIDDRCVFIDRTSLGAQPSGQEELFYYHVNNLFSVAALTNQSGAIIERYAYSPYGTATFLDASPTPTLLSPQASTLNNPHQYTGRRLDQESSLYYYRARYYDAALGRFINRDPIKYHGGINLYAYVNNGSMNYLDPLGSARISSRIQWIRHLYHQEITPPTGRVEQTDFDHLSGRSSFNATFSYSATTDNNRVFTGAPSGNISFSVSGDYEKYRDTDSAPSPGTYFKQPDTEPYIENIVRSVELTEAQANGYCIECIVMTGHLTFVGENDTKFIFWRGISDLMIAELIPGIGWIDAMGTTAFRLIRETTLREYLTEETYYQVAVRLIVCADGKTAGGIYNLPNQKRKSKSGGAGTMGPGTHVIEEYGDYVNINGGVGLASSPGSFAEYP